MYRPKRIFCPNDSSNRSSAKRSVRFEVPDLHLQLSSEVSILDENPMRFLPLEAQATHFHAHTDFFVLLLGDIGMQNISFPKGPPRVSAFSKTGL